MNNDKFKIGDTVWVIMDGKIRHLEKMKIIERKSPFQWWGVRDSRGRRWTVFDGEDYMLTEAEAVAERLSNPFLGGSKNE